MVPFITRMSITCQITHLNISSPWTFHPYPTSLSFLPFSPCLNRLSSRFLFTSSLHQQKTALVRVEREKRRHKALRKFKARLLNEPPHVNNDHAYRLETRIRDINKYALPPVVPYLDSQEYQRAIELLGQATREKPSPKITSEIFDLVGDVPWNQWIAREWKFALEQRRRKLLTVVRAVKMEYIHQFDHHHAKQSHSDNPRYGARIPNNDDNHNQYTSPEHLLNQNQQQNNAIHSNENSAALSQNSESDNLDQVLEDFINQQKKNWIKPRSIVPDVLAVGSTVRHLPSTHKQDTTNIDNLLKFLVYLEDQKFPKSNDITIEPNQASKEQGINSQFDPFKENSDIKWVQQSFDSKMKMPVGHIRLHPPAKWRVDYMERVNLPFTNRQTDYCFMILGRILLTGRLPEYGMQHLQKLIHVVPKDVLDAYRINKILRRKAVQRRRKEMSGPPKYPPPDSMEMVRAIELLKMLSSSRAKKMEKKQTWKRKKRLELPHRNLTVAEWFFNEPVHQQLLDLIGVYPRNTNIANSWKKKLKTTRRVYLRNMRRREKRLEREGRLMLTNEDVLSMDI